MKDNKSSSRLEKLQTFFLEGEVFSIGSGLVVASQEEERVWTANFPDKQVENNLDTEVTSVHVVSEEEIPGGGRISAHLKQLDQVIKLTMDISAHCKQSVERRRRKRSGHVCIFFHKILIFPTT